MPRSCRGSSMWLTGVREGENEGGREGKRAGIKAIYQDIRFSLILLTQMRS